MASTRAVRGRRAERKVPRLPAPAGLALVVGVVLLVLMGCSPLHPSRDGSASTTPRTQATNLTTVTTHISPATTTSSNPSVTSRVIGRSVEGRPIEQFSLGSGARRVVLIGGIHGDEAGGEVARGFLEYLRRHPKALPADVELTIIPTANPDGEVAGTRGNANGVDINRNFPSRNWSSALQTGDTPALGLTGGEAAGSEPETKALLACLAEGCDLAITLHSFGGLIDFDGPGASDLAKRMSEVSGLPISHMAHQAYVTGSLGTYVPERYDAPVITVELEGPDLSPGLRAALLSAASGL